MTFKSKFNEIKNLSVAQMVDLAEKSVEEVSGFAKKAGINEDIVTAALAGTILLFVGVDGQVQENELLLYQVIVGHNITKEDFVNAVRNAAQTENVKALFSAILYCMKEAPRTKAGLETLAMAFIVMDADIDDDEMRLYDALFA